MWIIRDHCGDKGNNPERSSRINTPNVVKGHFFHFERSRSVNTLSVVEGHFLNFERSREGDLKNETTFYTHEAFSILPIMIYFAL